MKGEGKSWIWRVLLIVVVNLLSIWLYRLCAKEPKEPRLTEDYIKCKLLRRKGSDILK